MFSRRVFKLFILLLTIFCSCSGMHHKPVETVVLNVNFPMSHENFEILVQNIGLTEKSGQKVSVSATLNSKEVPGWETEFEERFLSDKKNRTAISQIMLLKNYIEELRLVGNATVICPDESIFYSKLKVILLSKNLKTVEFIECPISFRILFEKRVLKILDSEFEVRPFVERLSESIKLITIKNCLSNIGKELREIFNKASIKIFFES